ncbi:MAG: SDR family oxidoreductase [Deltaproteobacteria bacterium]|nr:MAG: SDR family oxidoreductase [Deltaproteobacteria bacterium]
MAGRKKSTRKAEKGRREPPVLIAGMSGNLGRQLVRVLHLSSPLVGIDKRPFPDVPKDVVHYQVDPRRRKAENIFRHHRPRAMVHLGLVHRPSPGRPVYREMNVGGTIKLLEYCQRHGVSKVVLVSTAMVYGPSPNNSNFLTEDTPLAGVPGYAELQSLIEWDMYAQSFFWKHPGIETVILRPVHVVGPNVRNAPTNYLRLKRPITLLGFDPLIQLVHEQDLIQAILLALEPGVRGIFNIAGPGEVPLSRILGELGKEPLHVPHPVAKAMLKRLWSLGLSKFPPGELVHLQYQCIVDGSLARKVLGYQPRYTLRQTIRSVLG